MDNSSGTMKDQDCIHFLQWALPNLRLRWSGFRKVRGQVCKRLARRLDELELSDLRTYRLYLKNNPHEWHILDGMCRITISRFYRDRGVYDSLASRVFPELIKKARQHGEKEISCWCIGAASGEEPYSLSLIWELSSLEKHGLDLSILATEVDQHMINRARQGCYPASSLKELPDNLRTEAFTENNGEFCLKEQYKKRVSFKQQDIRSEQPDGLFHLIFCRNLVFTYFSDKLQEEIGEKILTPLKPGGVLVLGIHEKLPVPLPGLKPWLQNGKISRRLD